MADERPRPLVLINHSYSNGRREDLTRHGLSGRWMSEVAGHRLRIDRNGRPACTRSCHRNQSCNTEGDQETDGM